MILILKIYVFQPLEKEKRVKLVSLSTLIMTTILERYTLVLSKPRTWSKLIWSESQIPTLFWLMETRSSKLTQLRTHRTPSSTMKQTLMSLTMETTRSK